jgi:16S rRNA (adenine1518-N6/adenine1519-N6)-dimethyltransferase
MFLDKPKRYFGQHFLQDEATAERIVAAFDIPSVTPYTVIEVGPGRGALTRFLIDGAYPNFYLIEIDNALVHYLKHVYPSLDEHILAADFLSIDLATKFPNPIGLIGNFPYNISSQILFKVLQYRSQIQQVVCMVQQEFAERIVSFPNNRVYGVPSVLIQAFYEVEYLFTVGPEVFIPPPTVQSAVIRLKRNQTVALPCNETLFFDLVKLAFQQRRKKLKNVLRNFGYAYSVLPSEMVEKRAENLTVADFIYLTQLLGASCSTIKYN